MEIKHESSLYYISETSVTLVPNANGTPDDIAVHIPSGSLISVYAPNVSGSLDYADGQGNYRTWVLKGRNKRLRDDAVYGIFVRLSKTGNDALLVFSKRAYKLTSVSSPEALNRICEGQGDHGRENYWWIKVGEVSKIGDGKRDITLDYGILGTTFYNDEWRRGMLQAPIRLEVTNSLTSTGTPYLRYNKGDQSKVTLKVSIIQDWNTDVTSNYEHITFTVVRRSSNHADDEAWNAKEHTALLPDRQEDGTTVMRPENFADTGIIDLSFTDQQNDFDPSEAQTLFGFCAYDGDGIAIPNEQPYLYPVNHENLSKYIITLAPENLSINVDYMGNVIGGIYTDTVLDETDPVTGEHIIQRDYKLKATVTAKTLDGIELNYAGPELDENGDPVIGEDGQIAMKEPDAGEFQVVAAAGGDASYEISNGVIYITHINNIKDGIPGSDDDIWSDQKYEAMRNVREFTVEVSVRFANNIVQVKRLYITVSHQNVPLVQVTANPGITLMVIDDTRNPYIVRSGLPSVVNMQGELAIADQGSELPVFTGMSIDIDGDQIPFAMWHDDAAHEYLCYGGDDSDSDDSDSDDSDASSAVIVPTAWDLRIPIAPPDESGDSDDSSDFPLPYSQLLIYNAPLKPGGRHVIGITSQVRLAGQYYEYRTTHVIEAMREAHDGQNAITADLDNEMDGILVRDNGTLSATRTVTTHVRVFIGSTRYEGNYSQLPVSNLLAINGVVPTVSPNNGIITITWEFADQEGQSPLVFNSDRYTVTIPVYYGTGTIDLQFTLVIFKGTSIIQLNPTPPQITFSRGHNGDLTPPQIFSTCGWTKHEGDSVEPHPTPASDSGDAAIEGKYYIFYKLRKTDGSYLANEWSLLHNQTQSSIVITNLEASDADAIAEVVYILTTATSSTGVITSGSGFNVYDQETVPVTRDGQSVTVSSTEVRYYLSPSYLTNPSTVPDNAWQTSLPPELTKGYWLYTRTKITFSDGTVSVSYTVTRNGVDGRGLAGSTVDYYLSPDQYTGNNMEADTSIPWSPRLPSPLTIGYWLYTRTTTIYYRDPDADSSDSDSDSDSDDDGTYSVISISVVQIGSGASYAGTQEYYAVGSSDTTIPDDSSQSSRRPMPGSYDHDTDPMLWSGNDVWHRGTRPPYTPTHVYLWNFEVSTNTRGDWFVTEPICIGNYSKGVAAITEAYATSAYSGPGDDSGYDDGDADTTNNTPSPYFPSDIDPGDYDPNTNPHGWTDEHFEAAPTEERPFQWNRTTTTYSDNTTHVSYHISAYLPRHGENAVRLDLDNEMDTIQCKQSSSGVVPVQDAGVLSITHAALYDGSHQVTDGSQMTWSYSSSRTNGNTDDVVGDFLKNNGNIVYDPSNHTVKFQVTGIRTDKATVTILCTYRFNTYRAVFTLTRTMGDKYEIISDQSSVTRDPNNSNALTPSSWVVKVQRTDINGSIEYVKPVDYGMVLYYAFNDYTVSGDTSSGFTTTAGVQFGEGGIAIDSHHYQVVLELKRGNAVVDRETIPILSNGQNGADGADGADGVSPVVIDLTNQMDAVRVGSDQHPNETQSISTTAHLLRGSDKVFNITYNTPTIAGVTPTVSASGGDVTYTWTFYSSHTLSNLRYTADLLLHDSSTNTDYHATFTLNVLEGTAIYQLKPSASQVFIPKSSSDGTQLDHASHELTCGHVKREAGKEVVTRMPSTTAKEDENLPVNERAAWNFGDGLHIFYYFGGSWNWLCNAESSISGVTHYNTIKIPYNTTAKEVKFVLCKLTSLSDVGNDINALDGVAIDIETIPIIKGATDGEAGSSVYARQYYTWLTILPKDVDRFTTLPDALQREINGQDDAGGWVSHTNTGHWELTNGTDPEPTDVTPYLWEFERTVYTDGTETFSNVSLKSTYQGGTNANRLFNASLYANGNNGVDSWTIGPLSSLRTDGSQGGNSVYGLERAPGVDEHGVGYGTIASTVVASTDGSISLLRAGEWHTLSFWAKGSGPLVVSLDHPDGTVLSAVFDGVAYWLSDGDLEDTATSYPSSLHATFDITSTTWVRHTLTFKIHENYAIPQQGNMSLYFTAVYRDNTLPGIYISAPKLELSRLATDFNENRMTLRGAIPRLCGEWKVNTRYLSGALGEQYHDIVIYNNNYYECLSTHTSSSGDANGVTLNGQKWRQSTNFSFVATDLLLSKEVLSESGHFDGLHVSDLVVTGRSLFGGMMYKENRTITALDLVPVSGNTKLMSAHVFPPEFGFIDYYLYNSGSFDSDTKWYPSLKALPFPFPATELTFDDNSFGGSSNSSPDRISLAMPCYAPMYYYSSSSLNQAYNKPARAGGQTALTDILLSLYNATGTEYGKGNVKTMYHGMRMAQKIQGTSILIHNTSQYGTVSIFGAKGYRWESVVPGSYDVHIMEYEPWNRNNRRWVISDNDGNNGQAVRRFSTHGNIPSLSEAVSLIENNAHLVTSVNSKVEVQRADGDRLWLRYELAGVSWVYDHRDGFSENSYQGLANSDGEAYALNIEPGKSARFTCSSRDGDYFWTIDDYYENVNTSYDEVIPYPLW